MRLVFGNPAAAGRFALDLSFKALGNVDRIAVLDHMGRGAPLLCDDHDWLRRRSAIEWIDLSATTRPVALTVGHEKSASMAERHWLVRTLLRAADEHDEQAAAVLAEAWRRVAELGPVSLGAAFSHHLGDVRAAGIDPSRSPGAEALSFILSFPAVRAAAGDWNPRPSLGETRTLIWYEASHLRLDPRERDAALACALFDVLRLSRRDPSSTKPTDRWQVLHLFPSRHILTAIGSEEFGHIDQLVVLDSRSAVNSSHVVETLTNTASVVFVIPRPGRVHLPAGLSPTSADESPGQPDRIRVVKPEFGAITVIQRGVSTPPIHLAHQLRILSASRREQLPAQRPNGHAESKWESRTLFERIADPVNLLSSWAGIRRSGSLATGVDGESAADFAEYAKSGVAELSRELLLRSYRPRPVRRVTQPKKDGGRRPIGIAAVRDRIVQRAALNELHSVFDRSLSPSSFAYRPNRSALDAVSYLRDTVATEPNAVVIHQALNLCYSLLYAETWHAVLATGLDPFFGILHGSERDGGSLVFDLIEPFRAPFADRALLALIGRGVCLSLGRDGRLSSRTRSIVVSAVARRLSRSFRWRGHSVTGRQVVHIQAQDFARFVEHSVPFHPYRMKW